MLPATNVPDGIERGEIDFGLNYASVLVAAIDRGVAMKTLAGVHVGCFEVFVNEDVHSVVELRGRSVGVPALGSPYHLFLSVIAARTASTPVRKSTGSRADPSDQRSFSPRER